MRDFKVFKIDFGEILKFCRVLIFLESFKNFVEIFNFFVEFLNFVKKINLKPKNC